MLEIFMMVIYTLLALVIFYWIIPYGVYVALKQRNIEIEDSMRQRYSVKNHDYLNKYK
ncbi:hypothetical protein [Staphylococcus pseudintermedius]|uniref:hypothetical protein n=1 Tax=Staphylococcus pseudintermedius TaxID=283734 RepID=UPI00143FA1E7|nr:hypothetical protein [Staphylococcus pseudintermedius]EHL7167980.1 hypothetical protein [Staphylococcus pseudintermedius]EHP0515654.1 hypothetical protein [Staphylococcus pseudintermedius]EHT1783949.1 hypothetical protein [Staphylococcus pseudintermedius]EHT3104593.1 hypothetical protein [Staphylococcus pseudintermedius]EHT3471855.1 hypothetical protein [Staphylococcus pseudintermedius]